MPEPFSEARLAQLEERWRHDPGSRIFLQLAEELRRGGQLERATTVLRSGLAEHPTYLSAQVALGRCLIESRQAAAAAEVLERAVVQDPTQLVANKLLVEAYLQMGEAKRARERLDFYRLFNDRDDEIVELELRIRDLSADEGPATSAPLVVAAPEPFELQPPPALPLPFTPGARASGRLAMPFGELLAPPDFAARFAARCRAEGLFPIAEEAPAPSPWPITPPAEPILATGALDGLEPATLPADALPAAAASADLALALAPESPLPAPVEAEVAPEPPAVAAPEAPAAAAQPPWSPVSGAAELVLEAEPALFTKPFSPREIGAEVERETIEEPFDEVYEAVAVPAPAPSAPRQRAADAASVTLGELYLEQGHLDEAERTFRAVLAVRPGEATAEAGLVEIARRRVALAAEADADTGWEMDSPADEEVAVDQPPLGRLTQRKVEVLRNYLERIHRSAGAHVP